MRITNAACLAILAALFTGACAHGGSRVAVQAAHTIPGPETPALLERLEARVVVAKSMGELVEISIPGKSARTVSPPAKPGTSPQSKWSLGGPDRDGMIAFATDVGDRWTEHAVRLVHPDGREEELFRRPGGILWHRALSAIALAPAGGRIAFVSKTGEKLNDYRPLGIGRLEVWEPERRTIRSLDLPAANRPPSWFPDGARLAYVGLDTAASGQRFPVVFVVDVTTGERRVIGPGDHPTVSTNGRTILVHLADGGPVLVDVATGAQRPVTIPGLVPASPIAAANTVGRVLALVDSRYAIYRALPTEGLPAGLTANNSALVGPKPTQSIKLADLESGEFVTLVDVVDPRWGLAASGRLR
jgi:hypothetical protein